MVFIVWIVISGNGFMVEGAALVTLLRKGITVGENNLLYKLLY